MFRFPQILILLLSTCLLVSAQSEFADTRTADYGQRNNSEILVNSQGRAQHDLSVRGSSYSGTGISLNGLNLRSPISAHFNSELPLPAYLLSAPAARYGLNNVSGHLIGTAAYQTTSQATHLQAAALAGTTDHYRATVVGGTENVGGFLDWEQAREIDYDSNDMDRAMGGAYLQTVQNDWTLDLIGSHQRKDFGTRGYYGNSPAIPNEQQVDDSLLFFGASKGDLDSDFIRLSSAFRQMGIDEYDSHVVSVMLEGRTLEVQNFALNLRGDLENESVDSEDRTRGSILFLPEARFERLTLKAGLNSVFYSSEDTEFLPQAGIDWFAGENSLVYASYSENVLVPDYQVISSNPLLEMQKSRNSELGLRQFLSETLDWRIAGFYRYLENANDWVGGTATDLGDLNITGIDSEMNWYPSENLLLKFYYQWIYKNNEIADGLYESDYPEHLLSLYGEWRIVEQILLFAQQDLRLQTENQERTSDDFGAQASLGLHYAPRFAKNMRLSFLVENLWGSNFQSVPGVKAQPLSFFTGITVAW